MVLAIDNFAGGVNNREVPENIAPNEFADASNLLLSHGGIPEPRLGYAALGDTLANVLSLGVLQKTDGTEIPVARCSDHHLYALVSPPAWTDVGALSSAAGGRTCFVNYNGYLYIMDGSNFMKWDGTTLADVATGFTNFYPKYGCVHSQRLFVGNYVLDGDSFPNRVSWCAAYDDTNWVTGSETDVNALHYDFEVTGMVSFGNLLVHTRQAIYMAWDDTTLDGNYYFPSTRPLAPVGAAPWTMVKTNRDALFANATGVYSVTATQNFGDLEAARCSYKIDKTFESYFSTVNQDNCCAFYHESRDEYWLSIPTAASYKTLVGKVSLRDPAGRIPWMLLSLTFQNWCYRPGEDDVLFANTTNVYKYGGRADIAAAIAFSFTTGKFSAKTYERKRLQFLDAELMRWGARNTSESGAVQLYTDDTVNKTFNLTLDVDESSGPYYGTGAVYGDDEIYAITGKDKQELTKRHRLAAYARSWYLTWSYSSAVSGATIASMKARYEETGR